MRAELGVDALVVNPPAPSVIPLPPGDRIVTLSLNHLKGGPQFLRLARVMPHRRFLAVQGGYGEQLDSSLPNVEILDHVPHEQLAERVWSRAALFLQLSAAESWGMAASEARAHGIPIIAHPTPGLAENLGGSAVWANRDDTAMLAHVVDQVLAEDKYRRKSLARARVIAKTSSRQVAEWVAAIGRLGDEVDQRDGAARGLLSVGA
jgi:glycosyltransferase involved in cell wall biosynthesis